MSNVRPINRYATVDLDSPDPTDAINAFLHSMNKARSLGMSPCTEHTLAEHLFRRDAKVILYSAFKGVMALVGDEDLFDDDFDLELLQMAAKRRQQRTQGRKAAEAVAGIARHFAQGIEAGTDETPEEAAQPEGQEPGSEGMRPNDTTHPGQH